MRQVFVNILYDNYCDGLNAPESVKGKQLRHSKLSNNRISRLHVFSCQGAMTKRELMLLKTDYYNSNIRQSNIAHQE